MTTNKLLSTVLRSIPKHAPIILTVCAAAGVIATGVLSARSMHKVDEENLLDDSRLEQKEKAQRIAMAFAPPIIVGSGTIVAIGFSEYLNHRNIAAISAACAATTKLYRDYRVKVDEIVDEGTKVKIREAVQETRLVGSESPYVPGVHDELLDDKWLEQIMFFDAYSKRYFRNDIESVQSAEYHLNRNYILRGYVTINEFYNFLNLPPIDGGDDIGWSFDIGADWGYSWIDFSHRSMQMENGETCYILDYEFEPVFLMYG